MPDLDIELADRARPAPNGEVSRVPQCSNSRCRGWPPRPGARPTALRSLRRPCQCHLTAQWPTAPHRRTSRDHSGTECSRHGSRCGDVVAGLPRDHLSLRVREQPLHAIQRRFMRRGRSQARQVLRASRRHSGRVARVGTTLGLNSGNSSQPPWTDRPGEKPVKTSRTSSGKKRGDQPGVDEITAAASTSEVENIDETGWRENGRRAVIFRKLCFGIWRSRGSDVLAATVSVVDTCRRRPQYRRAQHKDPLVAHMHSGPSNQEAAAMLSRIAERTFGPA